MPVLGNLLPKGEVECSPRDRLNLRTIIYQRALEALIGFETNRFLSLDAPAGDQACQIRALQLCQLELEGIEGIKAVIKQRWATLESLQKKNIAADESCQERVEMIQKEKQEPLSELNQKIVEEREQELEGIPKGDPRIKEINQTFGARFREVSLKKQPVLAEISELKEAFRIKQKQLIEDDTLELTVDPAVLFLTRCYLVTLVKVDVVRQEMGFYSYQIHFNSKKLGECEFVVPTQLLIEIVDQAKRAICQDSIAYIQDASCKLDGMRGEELQAIATSSRRVESKERFELPFFHLIQVIFQRAMKEQIPILVKVRNIAAHPLTEKSFVDVALFKSTGETYKVSEILSEDLAKRVIVIEGYSKVAFEKLKSPEFVDRLLDQSGGLLRLIDLNTAQHGQFTDQSKSCREMFRAIPRIESEEEEMLVQLFEEAVVKGFSMENPSVYCIDHVFCDLLGNLRGL